MPGQETRPGPLGRDSYGPAPDDHDSRKVYDVCVLGSGASGSVAASEFVKAGWSVVMLEQGPFVSPAMTYDDILRASEPAYVRQSNGCWGLSGYPWTTCNVGGGTVFYGGASFRYREVDFDAGAHMGDADLPVVWPYRYGDLAAFYDELEELIGIAGDPAADPTAPPSHTRAPLPPVEMSAEGRMIHEAARSLGLRPFPTPMAISTRPYRGRPQCAASSPCIEHACEHGSKADARLVFLRPLEAEPGFRLFAGMKAVRLERTSRERVGSVVCLRVDTGREYVFRARYFVVACNAIQSAALLLRSGDEWCAEGIGNEYGMVGRGLCFKMSEYATGYRRGGGLPPEGNGAPPRQGPFSTVSLTDYYVAQECPTGLGGLIYESRYGFPFAARGDENFLRLECLVADQPAWRNRVHLSADTDRWGLPHLVLDYLPHPRDLARLDYMAERCEELLRAAGCKAVRREPSGWEQGSGHLHGTCRAGEDPHTSVLDSDSRVHTVDNLYVVDGAFMPYPGSVNPTLTIQAHALRAARRLVNAARGRG